MSKNTYILGLVASSKYPSSAMSSHFLASRHSTADDQTPPQCSLALKRAQQSESQRHDSLDAGLASQWWVLRYVCGSQHGLVLCDHRYRDSGYEPKQDTKAGGHREPRTQRL